MDELGEFLFPHHQLRLPIRSRRRSFFRTRSLARAVSALWALCDAPSVSTVSFPMPRIGYGTPEHVELPAQAPSIQTVEMRGVPNRRARVYENLPHDSRLKHILTWADTAYGEYHLNMLALMNCQVDRK
jgi:hypothetical protein